MFSRLSEDPETAWLQSISARCLLHSGFFQDNDNGASSGDFATYDAGSGPTSSALDSTSIYNADVTYGDGSTSSIQVVVLQGTNGDVFVVDMNTELDNVSVQSIELTSEVDSNYSGALIGPGIENSSVVCFAAGTLISSPLGEIAVQDLRPGMLVTTKDHGAQPVLWINQTNHLKPDDQAPISFEPGCLGAGTPARRLRVSPQHRILLRSPIVARMCNTPEVLVAAKHLSPLRGVTQSLGFLPTQYHHFACARHEIVFANGTEVETFFAGKQALAALSDRDLRRLNCQANKLQSKSLSETARPFLNGKRLRHLIDRHQKNQRDFVVPSVVSDNLAMAPENWQHCDLQGYRYSL